MNAHVDGPPRFARLARHVGALAPAALVTILGWVLVTEGVTGTRAALFGAIGVAAVAGGVGVRTGRGLLAGGSILALFLLGFWQAVLGIFVVPTALALALAAALAGAE